MRVVNVRVCVEDKRHVVRFESLRRQRRDQRCTVMSETCIKHRDFVTPPRKHAASTQRAAAHEHCHTPSRRIAGR